jgi:hypothetical protein
MELALKAGCWIKCYTYLSEVLRLYNNYNLFYHYSYKYVQLLTPSAPQAIPPCSK